MTIRDEGGDPTPPQFGDIDAYGASHMGLVRKDNQDDWFVGGLASTDHVEPVPYGDEASLPPGAKRVASIAIVADGAGGVSDGGEAARVAVRELLAAVALSFDKAMDAESRDPEAFSRLLQEAALSCHDHLLERARAKGEGRRFATTLTFFLGLWPHAYLLQLGDSRCYIFRDGQLTQISRDQTIAQDLIDSGVMSRNVAERTRWAHVLSSAMGGDQAVPVVTRVVRDWGNVILLCSDGLTKHVSDERIRERVASMTGARQLVEQLIQDALEGGGTDNVTVVVGRTLPPQ